MKVCFVLFDKITLLDFIGIYDPLSRIQSKKLMDDFSWDLVAMTPEIKDSFGLTIKVDKVLPDLGAYDMVIIPGGFGTRPLQFDTPFVNWIKTANAESYKVSVCTGSLLLGAAGWLEGKVATTNFGAYDLLDRWCDQVVAKRIVQDGKIITAGAVATSLDVGLYICNQLVGAEKTEIIRKSMDYYPSTFEILKH